MTITVPIDGFATFVAEHPGPAVALVFMLGVVLPAVWSPRRHAAAIAVLQMVRDVVLGIALIVVARATTRRR